MKNTLTKKAAAIVLAAVLVLTSLAACQTKASVVKRTENSNRGTQLHSGF